MLAPRPETEDTPSTRVRNLAATSRAAFALATVRLPANDARDSRPMRTTAFVGQTARPLALARARTPRTRAAAAAFAAPPAPEAGRSDPACDWPRSCELPAAGEARGATPARAGPLGSLGALLGLRRASAADDADLPPDVEQLALFADASAVATGETSTGWWARLWRYQGP